MSESNHFYVFFISQWLIYDIEEVAVSLDGKVSHTGLVSQDDQNFSENDSDDG